MFAVVSIAGFQELVKVGDTLNVPLHAGSKKDAQLVFDKVLLVGKDSDVSLGLPFLSGAKVEAKVLEHGRGDKIRVVKAHKRKRYRRVKGHRQDFTMIEVTGISLGK